MDVFVRTLPIKITCLQMKIILSSPLHCQLSRVLQKHYTEVMAKFRKFQRPVDFEPKLTHVKRVLDEIEERIHLIELRSEDPDVIQGQLDQCMVGSIFKCIAQFCIYFCTIL